MKAFQQFPIDQAILRAIKVMGFEEPSPIQAACIPKILEGMDVIGQAQTGTGKTAAFGIPMVERVTSDPHIQGLVLTPTRELAIQVAGEIRKISKFKRIKTIPVYGGQSIQKQIRALKQGVQIVVGTPGRILDHIRRKTLRLQHVKMVVLDEADEMLDMGFIDDIRAILGQIPDSRQTLLFSATMPDEIRKLADRYMKRPYEVRINREKVAAPQIEQVYYKVFEHHKVESLCRIMDSEDIQLGMIFCRTKKGVDELTEELKARGYLAEGLHGDLSQAQRDRVMQLFRKGKIDYLVATDVAARGIDVGDVTHVINFDIPQDPESYVHRIGRTGRAGRKGLAITLVTPREIKQLRTIEQVANVKLTPRNMPTSQEVRWKRNQHLKSSIEEVLAYQDWDPALEQLLEELLQRHDAKEIALAGLHLAFKGQLSEEESAYDFGDTGAQKGMVRFFINVGKNINLSPQVLAEEVSGLAGISSSKIGRIDIFDRFTFMEVSEEEAPFVYEALRQGRLQGTRVNVEPAKPRR